jgi:NAD+ synthase
MTYDEIDSILFCLFEKKLSVEETAKITQIEKHLVDKIHVLNKNSQHKRIIAARPFE